MKRLTGSHFGLLAAFVCCGMINHKDLAIVRFHGQTLVVDTGGDTLLTRSTVLKLGLRTHLAHKNKATFAEGTLKLLGRRDGFIVAPQAYFSHWYLGDAGGSLGPVWIARYPLEIDFHKGTVRNALATQRPKGRLTLRLLKMAAGPFGATYVEPMVDLGLAGGEQFLCLVDMGAVARFEDDSSNDYRAAVSFMEGGAFDEVHRKHRDWLVSNNAAYIARDAGGLESTTSMIVPTAKIGTMDVKNLVLLRRADRGTFRVLSSLMRQPVRCDIGNNAFGGRTIVVDLRESQLFFSPDLEK